MAKNSLVEMGLLDDCGSYVQERDDENSVLQQIKWTPDKLMLIARNAVDDALEEFCRQSGSGDPQILKEAKGSLGAGPALCILEKALSIAFKQKEKS